MNRDLTIQVNVNPNGQPAPTQADPTPNPQAQELEKNKERNVMATAVMASVVERGISIGVANIGQLTGSKTAQRNVNRVASMAALGATALTNPISAALFLGAQVTAQSVQNGIENRNLQFEIDYNRTLRQNTYNKNRR